MQAKSEAYTKKLEANKVSLLSSKSLVKSETPVVLNLPNLGRKVRRQWTKSNQKCNSCRSGLTASSRNFLARPNL